MSNIQKPDSDITTIIGHIQKGGKIQPFLKDIFLIKLNVAGLDYIDNIDEIFSKIRVGDRLELIREASNEYDKHAILVKYHGEKIGYVPRKDNYVLSKLMDGGKHLYGVVDSFGVDEVYENYEFRFVNFKIFLNDY
ncbi:MAG: HIRAN domain-containing protein [Methanobrevibacter sp.]|uniref:Restriction endonuclease n=1 Tax=Methanobrevibacter millerae TaxID=230361 RepID=A0A8T3VDN5_9EURY|nr:HIRAN domain-containing protein [Methanobrevibacter millerae]MBE6506229.1 restriction endonuclease [Methanobrevibacter millerae]MBR0371523.1 HIRAN domain-containing protein [Methanobrevibacter sp.]